jgi:hypothetical protein
MKSGIHVFEEDSQILQRIAGQFTTDSKEYATLMHAAMALLYVLTDGNEKFMEHVRAHEGDLTPEQRAHLIGMGLEPDSEP